MDSSIFVGAEGDTCSLITKYFQLHTKSGTLMSLLEIGTSLCDNLTQYVPQ
jgi:hypothetical protein